MNFFQLICYAGIVFSFFFEKNIFQFPLFFLFSFFIAVSQTDFFIVVILFLFSFFFDGIVMNQIGATNIFFIISLLVYFYNPFSIDTTNSLYLFISAFCFGMIYSYLFSYPINILQYIGFFGMIGVLYYSLHNWRYSHEVTLS